MLRATVIKRFPAGEVGVVDEEIRYTGEVREETEHSLTLGSKYGTITFAKNPHTQIVRNYDVQHP